jgi:hypothetical protein
VCAAKHVSDIQLCGSQRLACFGDCVFEDAFLWCSFYLAPKVDDEDEMGEE